MPRYNRADLGRMASESGFVRDTFEKVLRLKEILKFLNEDEFLREHLLLKGGTAINLTVFNLPRLSVDIDMDYLPFLPVILRRILRKKMIRRLTKQRYIRREQQSLIDNNKNTRNYLSYFFMIGNQSFHFYKRRKEDASWKKWS